MTKIDFITNIMQAASSAEERGALFNLPVLCAQAALESGWGESLLTKKANNLFGIKAGKSWTGDVIVMKTREFSAKKGWYTIDARWRSYDSWADCIVDYALLIGTLRWFRDALPFINDPDEFLRHILPEPGEPGWATDPKYFEKVKKTGALIQQLGGPKWERVNE